MAPEQPDPGAPQPDLRRVETIYFEVAPLAPVDREAAIRRLCGGDAALEHEVRSMVAWGVRLGTFLEEPAMGGEVAQLARESVEAELPDPLVGAVLGAYTVRSRLASGGMGTVYLGERSDGQFEQRVAIKVVKRGMDSEEILRRFHAERQTLAALDHPSIARLIDGGLTPDGRPFIVMEHVDGLPIDRYCDSKRLRVSERLTLFCQVCDAVHHAHRNLVVHRDLKPGNILVTPEGVPKLLDFGIAKVLTGGTTDVAMTHEQERRFTPEYASPEQVDSRPITTSSDVYSLGVILYELLTGTRPYFFAVRSPEELRRVIGGLMPPAPSAVILQATPRMRTTTAVPGPGAPASKGITRPGASDVGTSATTPSRQPGDTLDPGHDAGRTRGLSTARLRSVLRGDLDTIVLHALRKEPGRRYASAEQFAADVRRYLGGLPVQARRDTLMYRASKFLSRHAVGASLAVAAFLALSAATVMLTRQGHRLEAQRDALRATNRSLEEARGYLVTIIGSGETGVQGPDAKLGTVLADAMDALEARPPTDPLTRAAAQAALGRAVLSLGMPGKARPLLEAAEKAFAVLPGAEEVRTDTRLALAELEFFEGRPAEAERRFREMLAVERASPSWPTERGALLLNNIGAALRAQQRADEAIAIQREALAARVAIGGEKTLAAAESHNNLGTALFQSGDLPGAIEQFRLALTTRAALLRADHPLVVRVSMNLGLAELRAGHVEQAVDLLRASADAWPRAFGPDHPGRVATNVSFAKALRAAGKARDAADRLRELLAWQQARTDTAPAALAATRAHLGETLLELGEAREGVATLEEVIPELKGAGAAYAGIRDSSSAALAKYYESIGQAENAARWRPKPP